MDMGDGRNGNASVGEYGRLIETNGAIFGTIWKAYLGIALFLGYMGADTGLRSIDNGTPLIF